MPNEDKENNPSRTPTWQWIAGLAISILLFLAGVTLSETRNDVKSLYLTKVDKDAYYRDIVEIKDTLKEIQKDMKESLREVRNNRGGK